MAVVTQSQLDAQTERLIRLYSQAAAHLEMLISESVRAGSIGTIRFRRRRLFEIHLILRQLHEQTGPLGERLVHDSYLLGLDIVGAQAAEQIALGEGIHRLAVEEIAHNLDMSLQAALVTVGRRANDAIRRATLHAVGEHIITGSTYQQATELLKKRLLADGVTGLVDRGGRRWSLDTYAEMTIRTTTRQAVTQGTVNGMTEAGKQLVQVSHHVNSCEVCLPYDGNTYALPTASANMQAEYPVLDHLPPFHPNCKHVIAPASSEFDRLEAELLGAMA